MSETITFRADDIATVVDQGTVVTITGTDAVGTRVTIGIDHGQADALLRVLLLDFEEEVTVEAEDWMILGRRRGATT